MMIEQKGNTVNEAIETALRKLGVPREKVKIEVIREDKKGMFGLGGQQAIVRITAVEEEQQPSAQEERPAAQNIPKAFAKNRTNESALSEKPQITGFLQEVLKSLGVEAKFKTSTTEDESQVVDIITSDSALLIGNKGKNLEALQYLTNIVANKGATKRERILLDSEGYREKRKETLVVLAKKIADEVRQTSKSVSLEPMSAYERRIVHLALQDDPDVSTESEGDGDERHVVIKMRKGVS